MKNKADILKELQSINNRLDDEIKKIMIYKYNIVYFSSENVSPVVLKSSNDETFFKDFDGAYIEDNVYLNLGYVKDSGYGFFKAEITVEYNWGELSDIRIDNIKSIDVAFDIPFS